MAQSSSRVRYPADKILSGEWASHHEPIANDKGWWDWRGERVFLFADSHVSRHAAARVQPARDDLPDPNLTQGGVRGFDVR